MESEMFDRRSLLAGEKRYLSDQKCFGAPIPPWKQGAKPGWNYGNKCKGLSLPNWDGGDKANCWWKGSRGGPVCNGGNPFGNLPSTCKPPLIWKPWHGKTTTTSCKSSTAPTVVPTATVTATVTVTTDVPTTTTTTGGAMVPECTGTGNTYQVIFEDYKTNATSGVYTGQVVGAATQDDSYITFGMVDSVDDCFTMCDGINGCSKSLLV